MAINVEQRARQEEEVVDTDDKFDSAGCARRFRFWAVFCYGTGEHSLLDRMGRKEQTLSVCVGVCVMYYNALVRDTLHGWNGAGPNSHPAPAKRIESV